ncbi:MAG: family 10 glycosylhydrolase [Ruminococcus sp.]|nr:family 10 glycosylhydrolase [Ruminococcus sp.]
MKKITSLFLGISVLLTGCTQYLPVKENHDITTTENTTCIQEEKYIPLNFAYQTGQWFPYISFPDYMQDKTEDEFTSEITKQLTDASQNGINTVYFHIHPEGDAYYNSSIYPKGKYNNCGYDPLKIVIDTAHSMNISVHGWINPYRMQSADEMEQLPDTFIVKKWINSGSPMVKLVADRWYLNPAYDEVTALITDTVKEIIENYSVDGIHIDDYFYPATSEDFDIEAFELSCEDDLADWRRNNVTEMVKAVFDTVKDYDERILFGISPQGNINADYNTQFADVELWTENKGYADYIIPQIYYGFENEVCPFEQTLHQWEELAESNNVSLIIGLAEYKQNKYDKWAGVSGELEWIENDDIIPRQIELVKSSYTADGYALYK